MIRLGPGGEPDVIRTILAGASEGGLDLPPGDDATVLEGGWVLSTDLSVEDVHFRRAWVTPREAGYRAGMAAFSDLAAMGAEPVAVWCSVAGTREDAASGALAELGVGIREAGESLGVSLAGGDTTRSPGPLLADVVVLGRTSAPVRRGDARPGDELWVTGPLGAAAGAVRLWESAQEPPGELRERFARPRPRIRTMIELRRTGGLRAGLDLSDGLLRDAGHLAAASGAGVEVSASAIPVSSSLEATVGESAALELALTGGEDYELLVAMEPGWSPGGWTSPEEGVRLVRVGRVVEGEGVRLLDADGNPLSVTRLGFDPFGGEGTSW